MAVTCGHADPQHLARGAGGARADAHEDRRRTLLHEGEGGLGVGGVADRDRDRHQARELGERERLVAGREVAGRADLALDEEQVRAVLGAQRAEARATAGCRGEDGRGPAAWISAIRRAMRSSRIGAA